jgi:hypothetical protein
MTPLGVIGCSAGRLLDLLSSPLVFDGGDALQRNNLIRSFELQIHLGVACFRDEVDKVRRAATYLFLHGRGVRKQELDAFFEESNWFI